MMKRRFRYEGGSSTVRRRGSEGEIEWLRGSNINKPCGKKVLSITDMRQRFEGTLGRMCNIVVVTTRGSFRGRRLTCSYIIRIHSFFPYVSIT
jgi:hypothetical protein